MAKIVKSAVSGIDSFGLGWSDGLGRRVGKELAAAANSEAYWRGIERAAQFRRRISVSQERRAEAAADERAARARLKNRGDGFSGFAFRD
jgi:hypothetical protein